MKCPNCGCPIDPERASSICRLCGGETTPHWTTDILIGFAIAAFILGVIVIVTNLV